MSITTHPSNSHVQVGPTNPMPVNLPPSPEQISGDMNGHHNNRINYMNEPLYVPYFHNGKYGSQAPNPIPNDVSISVNTSVNTFWLDILISVLIKDAFILIFRPSIYFNCTSFI